MPYLNFHFGSLGAGAAQTPACLFHCCLHLDTGAAARSCVGVKNYFVCEALVAVGENVAWQSDRETFGTGLIPLQLLYAVVESCSLQNISSLLLGALIAPWAEHFPHFLPLHLGKTQVLALGLHSHEFCKSQLPAAVRGQAAVPSIQQLGEKAVCQEAKGSAEDDVGEWALQDAAACFNASPGPQSLRGALGAAQYCGGWSKAGWKPIGRCATVTLSSTGPERIAEALQDSFPPDCHHALCCR